jgi:NAD(P)-dependent dehydrogenase (short-subunit alcohol dehydrogenase family)
MKKAIVIGASSGIGRELSKILSRNQYTVGVMARRVHLLDELRNEMGKDALVERIDVSDADTAMAALTKLMEKMGGVELVVISAGTGHLNAKLDWTLENEAIQTNVTGFAAMANVAVKHFLEKGSGHLVGISSIAALRGGNDYDSYNHGLHWYPMQNASYQVWMQRHDYHLSDLGGGLTVLARGAITDASDFQRSDQFALLRRKFGDELIRLGMSQGGLQRATESGNEVQGQQAR